jgi:SAM-dependent methyltransferase
VVEVGCGTGILAHHFVKHGYDYWGIDFDSERITAAQRLTPTAHFIVADARALERAGLPKFNRVFIHGVMHHLDDLECRHLLNNILSLGSDIILVVIEPSHPLNWWDNPLGALAANNDEGRFVRTIDRWRQLFSPYIELFGTRSLWPRWPVEFVVARLVPRIETRRIATDQAPLDEFRTGSFHTTPQELAH